MPEPGQWPCQAKADYSHERLVAFLYRVIRDGASVPGEIEEHAIAVGVHSTSLAKVEYTNPHIEGYARALAHYLVM